MFRDALKIKAQQVVADKYDLEPDWIGGFGQAEFNGYVSRRAQEYIESFSFLHYGEDVQVCNHGLSSHPYTVLVDIVLTRGKNFTLIIQLFRLCA